MRREMIRSNLKTVINALNERGYNAVHQIAGYLISNDPAFISSHKNARNFIQQVLDPKSRPNTFFIILSPNKILLILQ